MFSFSLDIMFKVGVDYYLNIDVVLVNDCLWVKVGYVMDIVQLVLVNKCGIVLFFFNDNEIISGISELLIEVQDGMLLVYV